MAALTSCFSAGLMSFLCTESLFLQHGSVSSPVSYSTCHSTGTTPPETGAQPADDPADL